MNDLERLHDAYARPDRFWGYEWRSKWTTEQLAAANWKGPEWDEHMDETLSASSAMKIAQVNFSWAIPNAEALAVAAAHSRDGLVEVGAGLGYWAHLLDAGGVRVEAFDRAPYPAENTWTEGTPFFDVANGGPEAAGESEAGTLLLCWPYMNSMAHDALQAFRGDAVVYVGEHEHGCCADLAFFAALHARWRAVAEVTIPRWPGYHDYMTVWHRR